MPKIFVFVKDGAVSEIWCDDPEMCATVVDQDEEAREEIIVTDPFPVQLADTRMIEIQISIWKNLRETLSNNQEV